MSIYFSRGDEHSELGEQDFREALQAAFDAAGSPERVLALPPDHTRSDSRAGELTCLAHDMLGERLTDVMPALGTHAPMTEDELQYMFGDLPRELIRIHDWKNDVHTLGDVDADFVLEATEGIYDQPWTSQVNKLLVEGGHDLILSLGQVVPHEVVGMANYNKNIFVGTGGDKGINESHYLSALYGMERTMGRCDTPLRRILNEAQDRFCGSMPLMYVLTVVESLPDARKVVRGIYVGDSHEVFFAAGELSAKVNRFVVERTPKTVVVTMDPKKYKRTWLANKAIYRTRMLIGDGGRLVIIAPGVKSFGESAVVDGVIRKYGYRKTSEVLELVAENEDLQDNLGAAAHLIHGTSEGRFEILYAPGELLQDEIESVGYQYGDWQQLQAQYRVEGLANGWHTDELGEEFYFVSDPGLGLWIRADHPYA
ncbi:MAG: lactate racemase domain-containing protein [Planctomycetota bacterium]|nr:lactate racemase domain-containing protein [Planctomycetota bacterium]